MKHRLPLRAQLFAFVLVAAILPIGLAGYSTYTEAREQADQAHAAVSSLAQLTAAHIHQLLVDSELLLARLAQRPDIRAVDPARCDPNLDEFRQFHPEFVGIRVVDMQGQVVCSAPPAPGAQAMQVAGAPWFQQVLRSGAFVVGGLSSEPASGANAVVLAYPLHDDREQLVGVLGLVIDLARYQRSLDQIALPPSAVITIADAGGTIIARSADPPQWIGRAVGDTEIGELVLSQASGQALGADGVERLWGFTTIPIAGWHVYAGIPSAAALAPARAEIIRQLLLWLALLLLLAALAAYLIRQIIRPIHLLADATEAAARDPMDTHVPVAGPAEIANVAERINTILAVRARTEGALRQSEERFAKTLRSCPLAISISTLDDGRYIDVNDQLLDLSGYRRDEVIGRTAVELGFWVDRRDRERLVEIVQQQQAIHNFETQFRTKTGAVRAVRAAIELIELDGERCLLALIDDITARKRAEAAQRFLVEASTLLASSLDYETTLRHVAHMVVPAFADHCVVDVVAPDGSICGLAVAHVDPEKEALMSSLRRRYPPDYDGNSPVAGVLRSGTSLLIPDITTAWRETVARNAEQRVAIEILAPRSLICVPLLAAGRVMGAITFATTELGKSYDAADLTLAEELARCAALAVDNARLYREAQEASRRKDETLALLDSLVATAPIGFAFHDRNMRFIRINMSLAAMNGIPPAEHLGRTIYEVVPMLAPHIEPLLRRVLDTGEPVLDTSVTVETPAAPGQLRHWLTNYYPVHTHDGQLLGVGVVVLEITERRRLEEQLLQAQKMESIGRLAGGIAHDFNNLLTAIKGYTNLALADLPPDSLISADLQEIRKAARRATELTRQLLAFARKQIIEPQVLNLNSLILDVEKLLRRMISADIELVILPAPELWPVKADAGQIEQVLINLIVNACDAMPKGGKLTIITANIALGDEDVREHDDVRPGSYVLMTISDTGTGMTPEVRTRAFEPFFTTKEIGRGTGLGLATCYGIVKQHSGHITITSQAGAGATFHIYLPRIEGAPGHDRPTVFDEVKLPRGTETVLLVEDEPAVRELTARVLRRQGYTVLEATNGEEALHVARMHGGKAIDLLLTDVVMPHMGGKALADQFAALNPSARVLFMSGYSDISSLHRDAMDHECVFLPKPFLPATLARKVREVLDQLVKRET